MIIPCKTLQWSGVSKREREREKRAKTAKLITFSGCSRTIKSSLKIRHPVKSFQMRSMVLFAEEGRRRRICLFCKLIKEGSSLPGLDGPTTRKIRACIREGGGEKGLAGDNNKIVTFNKSGDNNWARHLKKSVKLTCLSCHPFTNLFWYHFDFCSRQNMLSSHFVFLTHFLFGRKVVWEGFVFRTVTTFAAASEIIFQLLRQIGKPM